MYYFINFNILFILLTLIMFFPEIKAVLSIITTVTWSESTNNMPIGC